MPTVAVDGSIETEIKIGEGKTTRVSLLEAQARADAAVPGGLQGAKIYKRFKDGFWYKGKVGKFDRKEEWYRVVYEDGDVEDLSADEVLELLLER